MRNDKIKLTENFANSVDENNIHGNLLFKGDAIRKTFKNEYKLTGIYVNDVTSDNNTYTIKINGSNYISVDGSTELKSGVYYNTFNDNINIKSYEINTTAKSISIYGLNKTSVLTNTQYDNMEPIKAFNISSSDLTHTITFNQDVEYLIGYIKFDNLSNLTNNIVIEYNNTIGNSNTYTANGIKDNDNEYLGASKKIYFDRNILANKLIISGYSGDLINDNINIHIYGKIATSGDKKEYQIRKDINENNAADGSNIMINGQKCPSMQNIIKRQKVINDICSSISEKDKIINQQENYNKIKGYLTTLKKQELELSNLRNKLNVLKDNNDLAKYNIDEVLNDNSTDNNTDMDINLNDYISILDVRNNNTTTTTA